MAIKKIDISQIDYDTSTSLPYGTLWFDNNNALRFSDGRTPNGKLLPVYPSAGSGRAGIIFPDNPGGGSGDTASIKYYAVTGEQSVLELTVTNDTSDSIKLNSSGNVVISSNSYVWTFDYGGVLQIPASGDGPSIIQSAVDISIVSNSNILRLSSSGTLTVPGTIIFPNGSIQSTAWTGTNQLVNGSHSLVLLSDGSISVDGATFSGLGVPDRVASTSTVSVVSGQTPEWFNVVGDANNASYFWGASCVYDDQGFLYAVGSKSIPVSPLTVGVVTKFDRNGNVLWTRDFYDGNTYPYSPVMFGESIEIHNNQLYILYNNDVQGLGGDQTSGVVLLDLDGNVITQHSRIVSGDNINTQYFNDFTVDTDGSIYYAGFDNTTGNSLVIKTTSGGDIVWQVELGNGTVSGFNATLLAAGSGGGGANSIAVDANGVYVTGQYGTAIASIMYVAGLDKTTGATNWLDSPNPTMQDTAPDITSCLAGISVVVNDGFVYAYGANYFSGESILLRINTAGGGINGAYANGDLPPFYYDMNYANGYLYLTGATNSNPNTPYQLQWAKIEASTMNLIASGHWRSVSGQPDINTPGTDNTWLTFGHRCGSIFGDRLSIIGYTTQSQYDPNISNYVSQMAVVSVDTASSAHLIQTQYGNYYYQSSGVGATANSLTYVDTSNPGIVTANVNYYYKDTSAIIYYAGVSYGLTSNKVAMASTSQGNWAFKADGGLEFPDGTVQTTAHSGSSSWYSPNGYVWHITEYNGGFSGYYDGTNPLIWFDVSNAPFPPGAQGSVRGAIIQYHAYDDTTWVGQIVVSSDAESLAEASHFEHTSGSSSNTRSYWKLINQFPIQLAFTDTSGSRNVMIQWTAKLFWGSEFNC